MPYRADADSNPEQVLVAGTPDAPVDNAASASVREGLVTAIAHGFFEVVPRDQSEPGTVYLCTLRGRLRKPRLPLPARRQPPIADRPRRGARPDRAPIAPEPAEEGPVRIAPGDRVLFRQLGASEGVIEDVLPRRTVLRRARSESGSEHVMLANLDHAVLVFAVREPQPHFGMLDRYLALCEHAGIAVTICLNKVDLGLPDDVAEAGRLYASIGYPPLYTSAATGEGVAELRARLQHRTSLLTGPSGVGKSSLMNDLIPGARQRTGDVSEATGKGRHTTTGVRLLPFPGGGWLADSAGIRELALWHVPSEELPQAFVELRPYAGQCLYDDCEHGANEEGCALRQALAEGRITPERFASFERLLAEARAAEEPEW
jgi:ribosome biogenesis GTPase